VSFRPWHCASGHSDQYSESVICLCKPISRVTTENAERNCPGREYVLICRCSSLNHTSKPYAESGSEPQGCCADIN
jgi:hypothetical protein